MRSHAFLQGCAGSQFSDIGSGCQYSRPDDTGSRIFEIPHSSALLSYFVMASFINRLTAKHRSLSAQKVAKVEFGHIKYVFGFFRITIFCSKITMKVYSNGISVIEFTFQQVYEFHYWARCSWLMARIRKEVAFRTFSPTKQKNHR